MHIACTQENLLQGLSLVSHITAKQTNLPILGNVLLKTEGGGLKLFSTNLEMAISAQVRGVVESPGEFTVPAKLLQDYISLLPSGKVELILKDDVLEVRAHGSSTTMRGMPSSEFPLIPKLALEAGYQIKAEALKLAIAQTVFAVSASEARPELGGVACFFHNPDEEGKLVFAATDSYRLSERVLEIDGGSKVSQHCIVPSRAMQEMGRIISSYKDDVDMPETIEWSVTESQMVMTYGKVELISRLIEGSFPPYRQIMPSESKTKCIVAKSELQKAIKAASLFARQGVFDIHVEIDATKGMTVSSSDTGTGAHSSTLKADISGESVNKVILNYKYFSDGLSALSGDQVEFQCIDGMNPVTLSSKGTEGFKYIIMPIRS